MCTSVQNQPHELSRESACLMTGMTCQTLMKPQQLFFVEGIRHHPKQFHVGVAFCSSWWQQTWWTKCVSKHLAYPFPMTYFSSCEIHSHTNLLPKSLNISYHFTFFNICVQPKKKDFVSTWSHLRFRQEKTSKPKDTVGQLKWDVCVGSFGNGFVFVHICIFGVCKYMFIHVVVFCRSVSVGGGLKPEHVQPI